MSLLLLLRVLLLKDGVRIVERVSGRGAGGCVVKLGQQLYRELVGSDVFVHRSSESDRGCFVGFALGAFNADARSAESLQFADVRPVFSDVASDLSFRDGDHEVRSRFEARGIRVRLHEVAHLRLLWRLKARR